jgi:hypothetical protein
MRIINRVLFLLAAGFTFALALPSAVAAQKSNLASCPDLNGHYKWSEVLASADLTIVQVDCTSIHVQLVVDALGDKKVKDVQSPLDGVSRVNPNADPGTKEFVSAKFIGDVANIHLDDQTLDDNGRVTDTTHQLLTGKLSGATKLEVNMTTLDDQGNTTDDNQFEFTRVTPLGLR